MAFILNKAIVNPKSAKMTPLIPGCAAHLSLTWHGSLKLSIIAVYAPNTPSEHSGFWNNLFVAWHNHSLPTLNLLLGDFNLTEDPLDRALPYSDDELATASLCDMRHTFNLVDAW